MEIKNLPGNIRPKPDKTVTMTRAGKIYSIRWMKKKAKQNIQKLDKDQYIVMATGEVLDFQHIDTRAEDLQSVRQSIARLRDIINANVTNPARCLWITLTYRENMTDTKRLYEDFRKFNQRLKRYCKHNGLLEYSYISVAEPQGRGAFHSHLILIFEGIAPYIPNDTLAQIWGHGFTKTKSLRGVRTIGNYFTAYLCGMELGEITSLSSIKNAQIKEVTTAKGDTKAIIKGQRLKLYPPGFRLYRCSRGIKKPIITECTEAAAMKQVGRAALIYERTVALIPDKGSANFINYRTYNKRIKGGVKHGQTNAGNTGNAGA